MSFDIYLQSFRNGEGVTGDGEAAVELLTPLVAQRESGWARLATADGEADVHGIDNASTGLMFNHVSGTAAYALLYHVARRAGFVVMPVGCPPCIPDRAMADHLPPELAGRAVVIESGDDLQRIIENG